MNERGGDNIDEKLRRMYPEDDLEMLKRINEAVNSIDPTGHLGEEDPSGEIFRDLLEADPETRRSVVTQLETLTQNGTVNATERAYYQEALKKYWEAIESGLIPPHERQ